MKTASLPAGTIHGTLPSDLKRVLQKSAKMRAVWLDITPLARNEWICWVEGAKLIDTRKRRIQRAQEELSEGMRRPCCWPGCIHRVKNGKA